MYLGSDEFNNAIENTSGNAPKIRVTLEDGTTLDNIKSIKYYGGSNDSDDVSIGTTNMARIDVTAFTDKILTNNEIFLEQGIELADGVVEYMPIGYFTIQKPSGDIDQVTFTAYDRMQKFEKPYSSSLAYPTTSILILDELCQICGIELATAPDNAIEVTENLKGYTCREVLGYIASMHSSFACIDRYGRLNLRWYSNTPIEKSLKKIWHFEKSQDNFEIAKVDIAKNSETNYVSGDGITTLHNSNPLATQEITDGIFAKLGGFNYSVGEIEMLDDARLDPWDMISVEYYDGKTYKIPCMSLEHDFKAYSTTVKSVGKSESENEYRFTGPTIQYLNRMAADLLVANRVIATKVDAEYVNSVAITTENFDAKVAEIKELIVEEIDGKYANIDLANIDIANINVGKIGELFAKVGLIDRATIVEGHITGFLDAVEVNANKITAGTLVADRILLSGGEEGVLYALNNLGELTSTNVDTLDGYVLTDRTINADKLIANSITANELDVNQIFGNEAVLNKIVSQEIFTNAIETNRIIVGASKNASKALQEVNKTVKSITMHYLATTASSGVTTSTSGWTTTVQQINATKKYLWTYQTMTYADNTTTNTSPVISGVYGNEGKDGKDGEDGTNGTNGVGITSVVPLYYLKSNTTAPSAPTSAVTSTSTSSGVWTKSVPTYVANYTYFTCTQTQYTNGTYGWSTVVADNALTNANKTATTANATANTANTNANAIKNNIYKSGTTLIDGAKIYTGSITADKIDVDDLFAQNITADGSITGVTLISGTSDDRYRVLVQGGAVDFQVFDTRGDGDWKVAGSLYASSSGSVDGEGYWTFEGLSTSAGNDVDDMAQDIATINSKLISYVTPQMYGAIGDGITDDTKAFQKALNTGLSLYVPLLNGSRYKITDTLYLTSQRQSITGDIGAHDWAYFTDDTEYKRGCIAFQTSVTDKPLFYAKSSMNCFVNLSCRAVNNITGYAIRYEKDEDKTNADGTIKNCSFRDFNTAVYNVGRGLSCLNNLFVSCSNDIVVYLPKDLAWTTTPSEDMQHQTHPDLLGRALRVINNRHHITKSRLLKVVSEDYTYDGVNYITALKGAMITSNVCDLGRGSYEFDCRVEDSVITNNVVNRCQMTNIFAFNHDVRNTNICGNNVKGDIHDMVTPYTPTNFIRGDKFYNCTIANNNIANIKGSCIFTLNNGLFERNSVIGNVMNNTGYDESITEYQRSAFILANANKNIITNNVFGVVLFREGCCVRPINNDGVWNDNIIINNILPYGIEAIIEPANNSNRNKIENNM